MTKVGLVAAWEPELIYLHELYPSHKISKFAVWDFHHHKINTNIEIISVISGVGKTNSASCTQLLISEFKPDVMIMTGICGSLSDNINGGEIIVANKMLQHDVTDAGKGNNVLDLYEGRTALVDGNNDLYRDFIKYSSDSVIKVHNGVFVSGDQRIRNDNLRKNLKEKHNAIAVDQEIASFAYVSYVNKVPFLCVKSVSDQANVRTVEYQKKFKILACKNSCKLVVDFILNNKSI